MNKTGFLVIGAAKAGTTTVYSAFQQHPEIYVSPVKETNYFVFSENPPICTGPGDRRALARSVFEQKDYEQLFSGADPTCQGERRAPFTCIILQQLATYMRITRR